MTRPHGLAALGLVAVATVAWGGASLEHLEKQMAALVNADRAKHGAPPLSYHGGLAAVARAHSQDMKDNGFFTHKSKRTGKVADRVGRAGIPNRGVGENIARAASVAQARTNLMNSPPHRKNLLNEGFSHIGIGIVRSGGTLLVTQVFMYRVPVHDAAAVTRQIVEGIKAARLKKGRRRLVGDERLMRLALEHSQRAERLGKGDHAWLETRVAQVGGRGRWRLRSATYFITDKIEDVIESPAALSSRYEQIGVGVVQTKPISQYAGALWVTLICAMR